MRCHLLTVEKRQDWTEQPLGNGDTTDQFCQSLGDQDSRLLGSIPDGMMYGTREGPSDGQPEVRFLS
jgi:hypothetical protein